MAATVATVTSAFANASLCSLLTRASSQVWRRYQNHRSPCMVVAPSRRLFGFVRSRDPLGTLGSVESVRISCEQLQIVLIRDVLETKSESSRGSVEIPEDVAKL